MAKYNKEDILQKISDEEVQIIKLQFTDMFGTPKNVEITSGQIERALKNRCMFDGSAIEGFVRIDESDMYLYPDLDTFELLPWGSVQGNAARMICDVYRPNRTPFEGDPRYILKKVLKEAEDMGYYFQVGPECEFFLFHVDEEGRPTTTTHEIAGYFDAGPIDLAESVRRDIVLTLEDIGLEIETSHHELAPGQHEIDLEYVEGLEAADNIMTFKMGVKAVAKRHGLYATFMPKPKAGVNGSGMHINMSLADANGKNLFEDSRDKLGMSQTAYQFMAGILHHMEAMTILTNPLVNSYKRLIPGYDAPIYIAWSTAANRSVLIRIPSERGDHTRIELRCPDSAVNPYLALAACLAAGLDGIKKHMVPPESVNSNIFDMTQEEMDRHSIRQLPETLGDAIDVFANDRFFRGVLGEHIYGKYLEAKKEEWNMFRSQVTDWEIKRYLYLV